MSLHINNTAKKRTHLELIYAIQAASILKNCIGVLKSIKAHIIRGEKIQQWITVTEL